MLRSNCGRASAIQAFRASTSLPAVTLPLGVCTTAGGPASWRSMGLRSWMRMPMASATRRRPRTSLPGCTVAAMGEYQPAMLRAEPERRATSAGASAW